MRRAVEGGSKRTVREGGRHARRPKLAVICTHLAVICANPAVVCAPARPGTARLDTRTDTSISNIRGHGKTHQVDNVESKFLLRASTLWEAKRPPHPPEKFLTDLFSAK